MIVGHIIFLVNWSTISSLLNANFLPCVTEWDDDDNDGQQMEVSFNFPH